MTCLWRVGRKIAAQQVFNILTYIFWREKLVLLVEDEDDVLNTLLFCSCPAVGGTTLLSYSMADEDDDIDDWTTSSSCGTSKGRKHLFDATKQQFSMVGIMLYRSNQGLLVQTCYFSINFHFFLFFWCLWPFYWIWGTKPVRKLTNWIISFGVISGILLFEIFFTGYG